MEIAADEIEVAAESAELPALVEDREDRVERAERDVVAARELLTCSDEAVKPL